MGRKKIQIAEKEAESENNSADGGDDVAARRRKKGNGDYKGKGKAAKI